MSGRWTMVSNRCCCSCSGEVPAANIVLRCCDCVKIRIYAPDESNISPVLCGKLAWREVKFCESNVCGGGYCCSPVVCCALCGLCTADV
jgi:hypothetical protein